VLLVIPPSPFLLDERVFVSLGVLKVAAVLERTKVEVEVLDLSGVANYEAAAREAFASTTAKAIGITATTPQMPSARRIADIAREERPEARLIIGGPHPTLVSAAAKKENTIAGRAGLAMQRLLEAFDVVVAGDGELAIFEALGRHADRTGFVDGDDPHGPLFMTRQQYEESPWPARHLVDLDSYRYSVDGKRATSLIGQLGCPFGCGFCGGRSSPMLRRIRTRSAENVLAEVEHLASLGFRGAMFYDDELNVNRGLVELMRKLEKLQERLGIEMSFRGFIKSELFTDEQASAMRAAGFRWLLCGFEAADDRILRNINKRATRADNERVIETCHRHGIKVKALMSIGHPGETEKSVLAVRDWLLRNGPNDFDCTIISTYPGSPYYDEARPVAGEYVYETPGNGDRLYAADVDFETTADYYKGDPDGGYRSFVRTDELRAEDLVALRDVVERDVRGGLGIRFNPAAPGIVYEHTMGMGLPGNLLRRSAA
jgi:radical SAM superfamily enzyme YgiQ (UPF0313 family)